MLVQEVIALLATLPPTAEVRVWDANEQDYVPVIDAIFEDGHTTVDFFVQKSLVEWKLG